MRSTVEPVGLKISMNSVESASVAVLRPRQPISLKSRCEPVTPPATVPGVAAAPAAAFHCAPVRSSLVSSCPPAEPGCVSCSVQLPAAEAFVLFGSGTPISTYTWRSPVAVRLTPFSTYTFPAVVSGPG